MLLSTSISVDYGTRRDVLRDFQLQVERGEIVGLVGSSGCGKSTFALALLGLLDRRDAAVRGTIEYRGRNLVRLSDREYRALRGREFGLVLQSPLAAVSPGLSVGGHLREAWIVHRPDSRGQWREIACSALRQVSLPSTDEFLGRPARHLSVGMAQRLLIAMAILHGPSLLIADEATSALDVIHQAEILDLFSDLRARSGMAILFITHDLASAARLCDRIAVMHEGCIVESAPPAELFSAPVHEYTRRLVGAVPRLPDHGSRVPSGKSPRSPACRP